MCHLYWIVFIIGYAIVLNLIIKLSGHYRLAGFLARLFLACQKYARGRKKEEILILTDIYMLSLNIDRYGAMVVLHILSKIRDQILRDYLRII